MSASIGNTDNEPDVKLLFLQGVWFLDSLEINYKSKAHKGGHSYNPLKRIPLYKHILLASSFIISTSALALIGDNISSCTATKIAKDVLITSAHSFEDAKEISNILVFSTLAKPSSDSYHGAYIKKLVIHPSYVFEEPDTEDHGDLDPDSADFDQIDIALVFIEPGTVFDELLIREMDLEYVGPNDLHDYSPLKKFENSVTLDVIHLDRNFGRMTKAVKN